MSTKKVIVCQHGARHRYAIPQMFQQLGVLEALYTNSCRHSRLGRLTTILPDGILQYAHALRRLKNRDPKIPATRLYSSDCDVWQEIFLRLFKRPNSPYERWCVHLSQAMIRWGLKDASVIYNMYAENLDFLEYSRRTRPDILIMIDVYVHPLTGDILHRIEQENAVKPGVDLGGLHKLSHETLRKAFSLADILLCPSQFVADGVLELLPEAKTKIRILPYGSSLSTRQNIPVKGRFFWAGGDWFRKGLPLFAEAALKLKSKYPDMEFRVAGVTAPEVINHPDNRALTFLGRLNREEMEKEFSSADLFVLPSHAEGMASVVVEAMACGCPVAVTNSCGIDGIIDRHNGYVIEPDAGSVESVMECCYLNRTLRTQVAQRVHELAADYTNEAWTARLVKLWKELYLL